MSQKEKYYSKCLACANDLNYYMKKKKKKRMTSLLVK